MARQQRKYALDTNIFVHASRDGAWNAHLQVFHSAFAPFEYLSAVVVQELRAGAWSKGTASALQGGIFEPFERRRRIFTPSYAAWKLAGQVLARLVDTEGPELRNVGKAFANDVLLAASCRESGIVLITDNTRDFARIRQVISFGFVQPWPIPSS